LVICLDEENTFNLNPDASSLSSIPDKKILRFSADEFTFVDMILN